jgi:hypothetical protein
VRIPQIGRTEPLVRQAQAFLDWVVNGRSCPSGVAEALVIVETLEAATWSLRNGGQYCPIPVPQLVGSAESDRHFVDPPMVRGVSYPDYFPAP